MPHTTPAAALNAEISRRILAIVANGASVRDAMRQVLGVETVDAMIDSLYYALRAKGGI